MLALHGSDGVGLGLRKLVKAELKRIPVRRGIAELLLKTVHGVRVLDMLFSVCISAFGGKILNGAQPGKLSLNSDFLSNRIVALPLGIADHLIKSPTQSLVVLPALSFDLGFDVLQLLLMCRFAGTKVCLQSLDGLVLLLPEIGVCVLEIILLLLTVMLKSVKLCLQANVVLTLCLELSCMILGDLAQRVIVLGKLCVKEVLLVTM